MNFDVGAALIGTAENGPWARIEDPDLRTLVSRHVADACAVAAAMSELDDAYHACMKVRGRGPLPLDTKSSRQLAAIREYVALYPVIPDGADLGGDPEAMIFRDLRKILKETS